MGRYKVGDQRRVTTGMTVDPAILEKFDKAIGDKVRSQVIEKLLKLYLQNPNIIEEAK